MPNLLALLDAGIEPKHLESSFDVMCNFEDVEFPPGDAAQPDDRKAWKALEDFWKTLEPMLPPWDAATTCKLQQRADRFRREWRFASGTRARRRRSRRAAAVVGQSGGCHPEPLAEQELASVAKQLHADFRESVVLPYVTAWRHYVYRLTVTLLDNARVKAQEDRRRRNTLNFNDLLIITARLLRDNASVRRSLQQKYRWLFVDEFQDTDPLQAEIMFWLATDRFGPRTQDPRTLGPSDRRRDCSSSATRSSPSTAFAAPTSTSITMSAPVSPARTSPA